jgi:actin-related protein
MLPATEDLKRKMYGCILVVGGGMKFTGIGTWLQNRISLQIPYMYRAGECRPVPFFIFAYLLRFMSQGKTQNQTVQYLIQLIAQVNTV